MMNGIVMVTTKSYDKILWLRVVEPNNDPIYPVALYLSAIKEQGLC